MENELISLFFYEKPTKMLVEMYLNPTDAMYGSTIAKRIDCTYSHVIKILKLFEKYNLVKMKRKGRLNLVDLTEKGKKIAKKLVEVMESSD